MKIRLLLGPIAAVAMMAQDQAPAAGSAGAGAGAGGGAASTGGGLGSGGLNTGTGGGRGTTSPGQMPGTRNDPFDPNNNRNQRMPEFERPIFFSGKVLMADGGPPPEPVQIERVCNGNPRPEAWTDSKGRFSFQLGQNNAMMADASVSSTDPFGSSNSSLGNSSGGFGGGMSGMGGRRGITERDLMGCELRASLAGYRSEIVNLGGRRAMDNPDVGTIILRPIANVEGKTFSMTSQLAPKEAKKAYDKGIELLKKKKAVEAQKEFEKATAAYPKYAAAWHELGRVHEFNKNKDEARKAYQQALTADSRFVKPYLQLAGMAVGDQNWKEVADTTGHIIRLDPIDYPQAYFYNSVAYYNLQNYDEAEKSAREAVKRDERHQFPRAQYLLGILLAMKDEYGPAAENIKGYLKFAGNSPDSEQVQKQLADIEKRLSASAAADQPQAAATEPPKQQ